MLVTIIFRNSAAKMQRLNYFTVIIIRDQSEVAYLSDNLFNRNLGPEGNDHNPNFIKFQLKRACKVIELRSLLEMENISHLYISILPPKAGQPACHVACFSRPFDRARGRPRSGEPRYFFKKTLEL